MARTVLRYMLSKNEQQLWDREELRGWRAAMEAFVEDEARDKGYAKYAIYDLAEALILKDTVKTTAQDAPNHS